MVDAEAAVTLPGARLIVPECVNGAVRVHRADRVGEASPEEPAKAGSTFHPNQRIGGW